ncbi:phosphoenolpyruvate synthase [Candidatus Woesearchaeota archaeon]|nr:phosphoenolpyruvate synthase [Candidatus Woesearchaeota archaeon]
MDKSEQFILWFDQLNIEDVPYVGGKNASLGEMYQVLTKKGVRIPNGFAITAHAYRHLLEKTGIEREMRSILRGLNTRNVKDLADRGHRVRQLIRSAEFPDELRTAIIDAYRKLSKSYGQKDVDVAVRSSATAEDLPEASFAGQQETFLNIHNEHDLIDSCKNCFASLFTNRAISYRVEKGFDHFKIALSIGVQKMVRSDLACSGVLFTLDTETGFPDVVFVTASWGLGENVVQGAVNPDEFHVFKPTLKTGHKPLITKVLGNKEHTMIYSTEGTKLVKNVDTPKDKQEQFCLTDDEVLDLARWGCIVEDHYTAKKGRWCPMDLEWAKDGESGKLFVVQARPETVQSQRNRKILEEYKLRQKGKILVEGKSVGNKIAAGAAQIIRDVKDIAQFKPGNVLVTEMTDPDWVVIMKQAAAIVTDKGGRTCFTGDTRILTNRGFMSMEEVYSRHEGLQVPSLNRETLKVEWKPINAVMKRRAPVIEVSTSLTGRQHSNTFRLTPNHTMITIAHRKLVDKDIQHMLACGDYAVLAQRIPQVSATTAQQQSFAYLLGALSTDGHVHLNSRHGEITFVQKPTAQKEEFISTVVNNVQSLFGKKPLIREKPVSTGTIRGKPVCGSANAYRWFGKQMAETVLVQQQQWTTKLLTSDTELSYHFLAGVIDGDGTYNEKIHRINIYCSKQWLLESIVVACLRIGIVPQITRNRTVANVQIVEKLDEISRHTKRVKATQLRVRIGTRFFSARQTLQDILPMVNRDGKLPSYVNNNLCIDADKLLSRVLPLAPVSAQEELKQLYTGDIRQQRLRFERELGEQEVYNISVADNHNYIVFSKAYTPLLVNNCHAAIISRELGIPCVVGTNSATKVVKNNQKITVSCAEGDAGKVYDGMLKFDITKINLEHIEHPLTKVMMNVGNPEEAFELSFLPNDGVGLAREEFIINSYIQIHPMALINYHKLPDEIKRKIDEHTKGYADKSQFFVDKLAQGIATIAAAFYPKDVIVRVSDFKSNEYANLIGGILFEPKEENPMIGWRGAARYYNPRYKDAFALECKAIKKVRDDMGLNNVKVMIPMCRTVAEGKKVLAVMAENGLKQGKNNLQVYVMCELPANVVLADEFAKVFDGFSIGSNDLTQTTLGLDRDSALVADLFDERNEAVKRLVEYAITTVKQSHRKIGICGDAPSTYPEFAEFLIKCGIDSISLSPDAVMRTLLVILNAEKKYRQ